MKKDSSFLDSVQLFLDKNGKPVAPWVNLTKQHRRGCRTGVRKAGGSAFVPDADAKEGDARSGPAIIHPCFAGLSTNWVDGRTVKRWDPFGWDPLG